MFFQAARKGFGNHAWGLELGSRGGFSARVERAPLPSPLESAARAFWRYQGSDRAIAEVSVVLSRAAGRRLLTHPFAEGVIHNGTPQDANGRNFVPQCDLTR